MKEHMYPDDLKYNIEHTWLKLEDANTGRVGITQFAQEQLKEVVFIELPEVGTVVKQMEPFGVIESVKATNDLYSPVSGTVIEVNTALKDEPGLVNREPYRLGWMLVIKLSNLTELSKLITAFEYSTKISDRS